MSYLPRKYNIVSKQQPTNTPNNGYTLAEAIEEWKALDKEGKIQDKHPTSTYYL
jgi:hypothetical protein